MNQIGYVYEIKGKDALVQVKRVSACGENCADCSSACEMPSVQVSMPNALNAKIGDEIEIRSESKKVLKYALIIYLVPLVIMLGTIAISNYYFKSAGYTSDAYSLVAGIMSLAVSHFILKYIDKKSVGKITFKMIRIMNEEK